MVQRRISRNIRLHCQTSETGSKKRVWAVSNWRNTTACPERPKRICTRTRGHSRVSRPICRRRSISQKLVHKQSRLKKKHEIRYADLSSSGNDSSVPNQTNFPSSNESTNHQA